MLARLAQITGLNTPLLLGIALRAWSVFAGLITIRFVTAGMSATVQGYYYTFGSLTQLTQLVDLGLQIVVVQFASHEAAHLIFGKGGRVSGVPRAMTRLASIGRFQSCLVWRAVRRPGRRIGGGGLSGCFRPAAERRTGKCPG